jgi:NAD(P) transhydrogenase
MAETYNLVVIGSTGDRKVLGVHCIGDIASEVVGLGHVVLHVGGAVELFLTLALNMPTYSAAYQDAVVDGLVRLAELIGHGAPAAAAGAVTAAVGT